LEAWPGVAKAVDFWANVRDEAGAGVMVAVAGTEGIGIKTTGRILFASLAPFASFASFVSFASFASFASLDCWRVCGLLRSC
jgi:hypothetical protein